MRSNQWLLKTELSRLVTKDYITTLKIRTKSQYFFYDIAKIK